MRNINLGFTLFEVILVLLVLGIAVALAVPSYQASRLDQNRAEGKAALTKTAMKLEQYFRKNKTYTIEFTELGFNSDVIESTLGNYKIKMVSPAEWCKINQCYVLSAVPQGAQMHDKCGTMMLDSSGSMGPSGCW